MKDFLSKQQRHELLEELKLERSRRYADRIRIILLLDQGKTYKSIAEYLFLDESSIANYRKRYKEGGIEGLANDQYKGKKSLLTYEEQRLLVAQLNSKIFPTTKSVIEHIKKEFSVNYTIGGVTDLLHRLGFSFKKSTPVPGKAIKEKQERFINQYNGIKAHGPVYFADATHPEFAPNITYGWIRKGSKFEVKTNSGWRKRVNIYGLIEINTLDVITRSFETINQFSVCEILRALRRKNPNDKNLYVVLDGASYNRSIIVTNIAKELKIKIVRLPPYSPNLNPIERLWKFMKSKVTANRYFEQFDDFKHTLMEFFRGIRKYKNELETLITDNFQILDPLEI